MILYLTYLDVIFQILHYLLKKINLPEFLKLNLLFIIMNMLRIQALDQIKLVINQKAHKILKKILE